MLQNTFCHIPQLGPKTERHLWSSGVRSWEAVDLSDPLPLPTVKAERVRTHIADSRFHLTNDDALYFSRGLGADQHWRMFPEFRHSIAYLDIETTGLGSPGDYITTIALYDGQSVRHYVHGENLLAFRDDIEEYRLLITYNGKSFDLPFLRNYLRLPMDQAHIDLRHVLHSLGYRGGLKSIERRLGWSRGDLAEVDGYFAVLLWWDYLNHGNDGALETLLAYNIEDVVNLERLMVLAYNLKLRDTPFAETHTLPGPQPPENPFRADMETVERLRRNIWVTR